MLLVKPQRRLDIACPRHCQIVTCSSSSADAASKAFWQGNTCFSFGGKIRKRAGILTGKCAVRVPARHLVQLARDAKTQPQAHRETIHRYPQPQVVRIVDDAQQPAPLLFCERLDQTPVVFIHALQFRRIWRQLAKHIVKHFKCGLHGRRLL